MWAVCRAQVSVRNNADSLTRSLLLGSLASLHSCSRTSVQTHSWSFTEGKTEGKSCSRMIPVFPACPESTAHTCVTVTWPSANSPILRFSPLRTSVVPNPLRTTAPCFCQNLSVRFMSLKTHQNRIFLRTFLEKRPTLGALKPAAPPDPPVHLQQSPPSTGPTPHPASHLPRGSGLQEQVLPVLQLLEVGVLRWRVPDRVRHVRVTANG